MKIFVSHSSKDKWAARRVAKDIEELGHTVFLDEKDIASGEAIDAAIQEHLAGCDHLLLLLSPASLQSSWVLVELGGAIALRKKVIPILLYVGANEIPSVISMRLARDINDIGKYYEELGGTPKPPAAAADKPEIESPRRKRTPKFKVGDRVLVKTNEPGTLVRTGLNNVWISDMDQYLGEEGLITGIDDDGDCQLDIDGGIYFWAPDWLERIG